MTTDDDDRMDVEMPSRISFPRGENSENIFTRRAPSVQAYDSYCLHLSNRENMAILKLQFQTLLDRNTRLLNNLNPKRGKALETEAVKLIFYLCEKLFVTDDVKLIALEIYDRWVATYDKDINSVNLNGNQLTERGQKLKKDIPIRVCSCIQLASKVAGKISSVMNVELQTELRKMGISASAKKLISSELVVFRGLDYNVLCMTPLEVVEILLMLNNMDSTEFRKMYGFCVHIIDYVYFFKQTIYNALRNRLHNLYGRIKTEGEMMHLEYDYVLRGASIIQCAMFVIRPLEPYSTLDVLQRYTKLEKNEILMLAICIASSIFGMA